MNAIATFQPLLDHLGQVSRLSPAEAEKLVAEVIAFFHETPEEFVRRRHRELKQGEGWSNERIFETLERELHGQVFAAPSLSQRQIRRMIYG